MKRQLNKLTLKQLEDHWEMVKEMIEERSLIERQTAAAKEVHETLKKYGVTLEEIMDVKFEMPERKRRGRKGRKQMEKAVPKYVDPGNSSVTWAGRGRPPLWVTKHINDGGTLEDLAIKPVEQQES